MAIGPSSRRTVLRLALLLGGGALLPVVSGCSEQRPEAPPYDLRAGLQRAFRTTDPAMAAWVAEPQTRLEVVQTPWMAGWWVVDAQNNRLPHPRRVEFALAQEEVAASVLSGNPAAFTAMTAAAGVTLESADVARTVAETFLDVTRDFARWTYRVARFAGIGFTPDLTAAQQRTRDRLQQTYGSELEHQPTDPNRSGWTATLWTVAGRDLVEHRVSVSRRGAVTDEPTVRERDLPVPASV